MCLLSSEDAMAPRVQTDKIRALFTRRWSSPRFNHVSEKDVCVAVSDTTCLSCVVDETTLMYRTCYLSLLSAEM